MTQEDYLVEIKNKKETIIEQVLSGLTVLEATTLKKKGQLKESNERVLKILVEYNDKQYTLLLDAFRLSEDRVILYSDLHNKYELSLHSVSHTADNKDLIVNIKCICFDLNDGDLPSDRVRSEVVEEALYRAQAQIQAFVDDKNRLIKQAS